MKKLFSVLMVVLMVLVVSCENSTEPKSTPEEVKQSKYNKMVSVEDDGDRLSFFLQNDSIKSGFIILDYKIDEDKKTDTLTFKPPFGGGRLRAWHNADGLYSYWKAVVNLKTETDNYVFTLEKE